MKYIFTKMAENDLLQIKYYSHSLWGKDQAVRYLLDIHKKCEKLCNLPDMGVERPEINKNVRSIIIGCHIIFYQIAKDTIQILRILHKNMDVTSRFC